MKIIDLYLSIENNKNIPKKVVYKYKTYRYYPKYKQYYREEYGDMISLFSEANCDDKVYLIENTPKEKLKIKDGRFVVDKVLKDGGVILAKEDNKIEHINKVYDLTDFRKDYPIVAEMLKDLSNKQYEIIDRLNGEDNE